MRMLLLAGAAVMGMVGAAQADVVLTITTTGGQQPFGQATLNGTITITDAAFANGISFTRQDSRGNPLGEAPDLAAAGLVDIALTATGFGATQVITLAELHAPGINFLSKSYFFFFNPSVTDFGRGGFSYLTEVNQVRFSIVGDTFNGTARTDTPGRECEFSTAMGGGCTFSGTVTATPVPEPATLALFGMGLFGLAAVRRRA